MPSPQTASGASGMEPARDEAAEAGATFDVADLLGEIETLVAARPGWPCLKLRTLEPLPPLACDRDRFAAAVMNLLSNACDAMPNGGAVAVCACVYGNGEGVEVCIVDSGVGMSEATVERAFDPGFTTKSVGLGGLGLPLAADFAYEAGGQILVESVAGVGAIVRLRTPAARASGDNTQPSIRSCNG